MYKIKEFSDDCFNTRDRAIDKANEWLEKNNGKIQ